MAKITASAILDHKITTFVVRYAGDDIDAAVTRTWQNQRIKKLVRRNSLELIGRPAFVFFWEGEWVLRYSENGHAMRREFTTREAAEMWAVHHHG